MALLSLDNVSKAYAGIPALRGVDLAIAPGEIHALMGENGAGKSTLIKILAGVVAPDTATIRIDGIPVAIDSPAAAHRLGLRFIHQELNVVPALSVAENIFMGRPYPRRARRCWSTGARSTPWPARRSKRLGITHIDPRRKTGAPLASATDAGEHLERLPRRRHPRPPLRHGRADRRADPRGIRAPVRRAARNPAAGNSVLYVSHRLDEVMALCDRATVLRDGRPIDSGEIGRHHPRRSRRADDRPQGRRGLPARPGRACAEVRRRCQRPRSRPSARAKSSASPASPVPGQTRLLPRRSSAIRHKGLEGRHRLCAAERRREGLVTSRPIFENITLAHLEAQSLGGTWLTPRRERRFATRLGEDVRLRARRPQPARLRAQRRQPAEGGLRQGARRQPPLLLLDEPTRGVDVGAKFDIYTIIRDMTAKGMAVILVSSDLPELLGMATASPSCAMARIADIVDAKGLTEEDLLNLCYGRSAVAA